MLKVPRQIGHQCTGPEIRLKMFASTSLQVRSTGTENNTMEMWGLQAPPPLPSLAPPDPMPASPECARCALGYGDGVAHTCHECTPSFKTGVYVAAFLIVLAILVVAALLVVYLVSRGCPFSSVGPSTPY